MKKSKSALVLALLFIIIIAAYLGVAYALSSLLPEPVEDVHIFRLDSRNPIVVPKGDAIGYLHPDVKFFPEKVDGFRYWMYYTPWPPDKYEHPYLVRSNDGFHFTDEGVKNPLFVQGGPGSADEDHIADEDVLIVDGTWLMYYACCPRLPSGESGTCSICLARSDDGKNWEKLGDPVIEAPALEPAVVYSDGVYRMWYSCHDISNYGIVERILEKQDLLTRRTVCYSTSKDGIHWQGHGPINPVFQTECNIHSNAIVQDGRFWLIRRSPNCVNLMLLSSENGMDWDFEGNILTSQDPEIYGVYRSSFLETNHSEGFVKDGGGYRLYFSTMLFDGKTDPTNMSYRIHLAQADDISKIGVN